MKEIPGHSCMTLAGEEFSPGIHGVKASPDGVNLDLFRIPLVSGPRSQMPEVLNGTLWNAVPVTTREGKIERFVGGRPYGVATLAIDVKTLSFPDGETVSFGIMSKLLWPGGEGVGIPRKQRGDRASPEQVQLFVLRSREHILAIDHEERAIIVYLEGGIFRRRVPLQTDIFNHVIGRAMLAKDFLEVRWCLRVLDAMGWRHQSDVVVAKAMTLNPRFRLDWDRL